MTELKAKGKNVLVKKLNFVKDKTKKGLLLPQTVQDKKEKISPIGEIVSVGELVENVHVGKIVYYAIPACNAAFHYDNDLYMVFDVSGILLEVEHPEKINID